MASKFRVDQTFQRTITFYVGAEDYDDVVEFLENNPEWQAGDVEGLIDVVSDETEVDYLVSDEDEVVPGFEIVDGQLREIE